MVGRKLRGARRKRFVLRGCILEEQTIENGYRSTEAEESLEISLGMPIQVSLRETCENIGGEGLGVIFRDKWNYGQWILHALA